MKTSGFIENLISQLKENDSIKNLSVKFQNNHYFIMNKKSKKPISNYYYLSIERRNTALQQIITDIKAQIKREEDKIEKMNIEKEKIIIGSIQSNKKYFLSICSKIVEIIGDY